MKIESYHVYRLIFGLMLVLIIGSLIVGLLSFITESFGSFWDYPSIEISEWLINYEGGFVRRGICGQLLYILYQFHPYPIRNVIVFFYIMGFLVISGVLFNLFKKEGWSIYIIPFPICLYYAFSCNLLWTRRDYWVLLWAFLIYYLYFKFIKTGSLLILLVLFVLSVLVLLTHEASFFFIFPILIVHSLYYLFKEKKKCLYLISFWSFLFCVFFIIILHKGNSDIASVIWNSWEPCFRTYSTHNGIIPNLGRGVEFLEMNTIDTIRFHFGLVWLAQFAPSIPSFPFNIYLIICTYYLVTRLNTIDLRLYKLKSVDNILLSNILILQFIFLIPMFGFLSCDLGRIIPYWIISSLFLLHIIKQSETSFLFPNFVEIISLWAQKKIDNIKALNKSWVYCICIVSLPLDCYYGASYMGIFPIHYLMRIIHYYYL